MLTPLMHDSPAELAQATDVREWKKGQVDLVPGKTAPAMTVVERDYPTTYAKFTALGPLMAKVGNGGKGIALEHRARGRAARPSSTTRSREEGPPRG